MCFDGDLRRLFLCVSDGHCCRLPSIAVGIAVHIAIAIYIYIYTLTIGYWILNLNISMFAQSLGEALVVG